MKQYESPIAEKIRIMPADILLASGSITLDEDEVPVNTTLFDAKYGIDIYGE